MKNYILLLFSTCCFLSCHQNKANEEVIYRLYISDLHKRIEEIYSLQKDLCIYVIESKETSMEEKRENEHLLRKLETVYELGKDTDNNLATIVSKDQVLEDFESFIRFSEGPVNSNDIKETRDLFSQDYIDSSLEYRIVFLRFFLNTITGVTQLLGTR